MCGPLKLTVMDMSLYAVIKAIIRDSLFRDLTLSCFDYTIPPWPFLPETKIDAPPKRSACEMGFISYHRSTFDDHSPDKVAECQAGAMRGSGNSNRIILQDAAAHVVADSVQSFDGFHIFIQSLQRYRIDRKTAKAYEHDACGDRRGIKRCLLDREHTFGRLVIIVVTALFRKLVIAADGFDHVILRSLVLVELRSEFLDRIGHNTAALYGAAACDGSASDRHRGAGEIRYVLLRKDMVYRAVS